MPTTRNRTTPTELTDGVVRLRSLAHDDREDLVELFSDPQTARWASAANPWDAEFSADVRLNTALRENNRPGRPWRCAIDEVAPSVGSRFAGYLDLHPREDGSAGLDFALHPCARGRHLMTSAVRLACRWWFDQGGDSVTWFAEAGNLPSWFVVRSCGFTFGDPVTLFVPGPTGPVGGWVATLNRGDDLHSVADGPDPRTLEAPDRLFAAIG